MRTKPPVGWLGTVALAAVLLLAVSTVGRSDAGGVGVLPLRAPRLALPGPLLGFAYQTSATRLARIDPHTLRVLPGRSHRFQAVTGWAVSPGRAQLAVATCSGNSCRGGVRLLAMPAMRPLARPTATRVEGAPPVRGSITGDLWLVGHGDPGLNDAALERLAHGLRAAGIHIVTGSVVGVTDTFTRERWAPGWRPVALQFIALPTALVFDANSGPHGYVFDPERRAAAALTADLRALGIPLHGRPRAGPQPQREPVLARIRSAPLLAILHRQNRDSLNLDAEVLNKLLGAAAFGPPGSIAKGARAIQQWARGHGVRIRARDGSGLSYMDSITTNGLARLHALASREPWGAALRSTLPTPGQGTLAGRLLGLSVRAKSGTLFGGVSALSGWVRLRSGRWAAFSILSHGLPKTKALAHEDRLVFLIAKQG